MDRDVDLDTTSGAHCKHLKACRLRVEPNNGGARLEIMSAAPLADEGAEEELRLRTLYSYRILDTVEERVFDDVCEIAARICETPTALITLVDRRRQWFKSRVNFPERETEIECSFCAHAIREGDTMVVEDASCDTRFSNNRLVLHAPKVRFYAGVPITAENGRELGTLCVIDTKPRELAESTESALRALARQVEAQLELRRLGEQRDLLSRFVLHDMRNPLTGMVGYMEAVLEDYDTGHLRREELEALESTTQVLCRRVEDFQLLMGGEAPGLPTRLERVALRRLLEDLKRRMQREFSRQSVTLSLQIATDELWADEELLRRTLENLLYNAVSFAPRDSTVEVTAERIDTGVRIRVTDAGPGIVEGERERVFEVGASSRPAGDRRGHGLGLAFCALAARAMGGTITCDSGPVGARFSVTLPEPG